MKRTGVCLLCGQCCSFVAFPVEYADPYVKEFYDARGLEVVDGMVCVQHVCPHLLEVQPGKFLCELQGDAKPQACQDSPYNDTCKPAGCGFTFTKPGHEWVDTPAEVKPDMVILPPGVDMETVRKILE